MPRALGPYKTQNTDYYEGETTIPFCAQWAEMVMDMVADMEVDKLVDMLANMVVDEVAYRTFLESSVLQVLQ